MTAPLDAVRTALASETAWLVGGAVRDRLLGRPVDDLDVALPGDPRAAARAVKTLAGGAMFELSGEHGAWRVAGPGEEWHVDLLPLLEGDIETDLAARDFTVNAMAEPLAGGEVVDPHGGRADLEARRLRMVSAAALRSDPLRTLRAVRLSAELGFGIEPGTLAASREHAPGLQGVAAERIWAELRRVVGAQDPVAALRLMEEAGVTEAVLPELLVLKGVEQNVFHHLDVHDHTLAVLAAAVDLEARDAVLGPLPELDQPLAEGMTRRHALRFAALLHDIAKPQTRGERPDGRVTFIGHDAVGADMAAQVLRRLRASQRVAEYVAALTRHHLLVGFMVHERPLSRRTIHRYLVATRPYEIDVAVLTVADRLATRGKNAEPAIEAHLEVARALLAAAREPHPGPLLRGDELARELGMRPGPELGRLLARIEEDRFAGEISTREEALARARALASGGP